MPEPAQPDHATQRPRERAPCPYCGHVQLLNAECIACRGLFEPLSRRATQDAMGPWQVRDDANPFLPGCSYNTLRMLIARGRITSEHILRGPTTRQFWAFARDTPGVAHLLGECHNCHAPAAPADRVCKVCRASFAAPTDRASLGLEKSNADRGGAHAALPHHAGVAPASTPAALPFERIAPVASRGTNAARLRRTNVIALVSVVALCAALGAWFGRDAFDADRRDVAEDHRAGPNLLNEPGAARPSPAGAAEGASPGAEASSDALAGEIRRIVEGVDENDFGSIRAGLQALQALREADPMGGSVALLNAEIERLERRIDELTLRKFL